LLRELSRLFTMFPPSGAGSVGREAVIITPITPGM
jgi:hypothetical protein